MEEGLVSRIVREIREALARQANFDLGEILRRGQRAYDQWVLAHPERVSGLKPTLSRVLRVAENHSSYGTEAPPKKGGQK
jgi:hypothetical protein